MTNSKRTKTVLNVILAFILTYVGEKLFDLFGIMDRITVLFSRPNASKAILFFNKAYPLWEFILLAIILLISYFLLTALTANSKKDRIIKKQNEFKKSIEFLQINPDLVLKIKIGFDSNGEVYLGEAYPYCAKHGEPPIKMAGEYFEFSCPVRHCNSKIQRVNPFNDMKKLESIVITDLEVKWKAFNQIS